MEFTRDDRGVSEVIGAILVFGLLIALLAVMQSYAVPLANEEVEFNHNQQVQSDLVEFQETASRAASQGTRESVKIQMGTTYPSRLLFFSPNNPGGEIRTVGDQSASINNTVATDPTIAEYIDGSMDDLETKRVEYQPGYNEYRNPPTTVLEYGVLYNSHGEETVIEDRGGVVNGNSINLMFFGGEMARTSGTALSLEARPTSAPARTVTVRPDDSSVPVNITLPTRLTAEEWRDILSEEISDGNVEDVVSGPNGGVVIQLDPNVNRYSIRMPKIGVGSGTEQPEPTYIINAEGDSGTVPLTGAREVTFEVRDKYNNPVRDETVNVTLEPGAQGHLDSPVVSVNTNDEGRATVLYHAPSSGNVPFDEELRATYDGDPSQSFNEGDPEDVAFGITVTPVQGGVGPEPDVDKFNVTDDSQGAILDLLGEDEIGYVVDWEAYLQSNSAGSTLDTVELRLVNKDTKRIATTIRYDVSGQMSADDADVELVDDQGSCGTEYRIEMIVESTGGKRTVAPPVTDTACQP